MPCSLRRRALAPLAALAAVALCACGSSSSSPSPEPGPTGPPTVVRRPSITGIPTRGSTLHADAGEWTGALPLTLELQWYRCEESGACTGIPGAGGADHVVVADDEGKLLLVMVNASNGEGGDSATSERIGPARPPGPYPTALPAISGEPRVGSTLAADPGTWAAAGVPALEVRWLRCADPALDCVEIPGAIGVTRELQEEDLGSQLVVRVSATDGAGTNAVTSAWSPPVGRVACPRALVTSAAFPSVVTAAPNDVPWSSPGAVVAEDLATASAGPVAPGERTAWLVAKGFGLSLPAGATVRGFSVEIVARAASAGSSVALQAVELGPEGDGTRAAELPAGFLGATPQTIVVGGPTDLWGAAEWVAAGLAAPDFAVRLRFRNEGRRGPATVLVDAVRVTVHYLTSSVAGPAHPSSVVEEAGGAAEVAWTTPQGAADDDGVAAEVVLPGQNHRSRGLVATGFGLSLPAGKVPSGVVVEVQESGTSPAWVVVEKDLRLVVNGAAVGESRASTQGFPGAVEWVAHGGASDLWGAGLTAGHVAGGGFGVRFHANNFAAADSVVVTARVHQIRLSVHYDPAPAEVSASPTVGASSSGGLGWTSPGAASAVDGNSATAAGLSGDDVTEDLVATGHGLDLPDGAVVHGITLTLTRNSNSGEAIAEQHLRLTLVGETVGSSRTSAAWTSAVAAFDYGGPEDLWGRPWTAAEVESPSFGSALALRYLATSGNSWAYVDAVRLGVTYCPP